jgi:hypothetical protein
MQALLFTIAAACLLNAVRLAWVQSVIKNATDLTTRIVASKSGRRRIHVVSTRS